MNNPICPQKNPYVLTGEKKKPTTTEVSICYMKMSVGLFTTEIYAKWPRKEELERWV